MLLYDAAAGSDSFLWNGHTTLEANSRFICLDTHDLQNAVSYTHLDVYKRQVEYTAAHFITRPKMWRANTARTMTASIRAACVNAPVWRNGSKQVYWR